MPFLLFISWLLPFWQTWSPKCQFTNHRYTNAQACMCTRAWLVAQLCPNLCDPMDCSLPGFSSLGILQARILEWVAFPFSRGSSQPHWLNPGLPHCRWILYHLSHQGSPRILEWEAYPFSRGSSQPRNRTGVSRTAGWFFTSWATRETPE